MSAKDREKISSIRINSTSRSSSKPPLETPYNFGIDRDWLEREKNNFTGVLHDWGTYPGPPGFDDDTLADDEEDLYQ
jgi:hypothetical protein